ncbi:hypothetical protein SNE40_010798 [Patella caerulea]|uniref:protein-histidine N-methyltransferase n=1 Tax=Patella caerulea TaxID=87958 RepID=A0AAN8JUS1_PATCE
MGKKSKKGGGKAAPPPAQEKKAAVANGDKKDKVSAPAPVPELSKSARRDVRDLVSQLLDVCAKPPVAGAKEWDDYPEINSVVEKIRKLQSGLSSPVSDRSQNFPGFMDWLSSNGVDTSTVDISKAGDSGFGLKAKQHIKEASLFLTIPRKLMLTVDSAKSSVLGDLISEDKILQAMPNITLALHLLCEKHQPDSFFQPYINILPTSYSTPLYFTPEELQNLKGSPVLGDALSQYRNIARQYAYFYRLLQKQEPFITKLPITDHFTFDEYRWAVSTVMTRQNQIPTVDGSKVTFGLIPLWDMCNHTNGHYTSDFNVEKNVSECYALRDFEAGEQVYIFYGARSNAEFLIHNGFVYPENNYDRLCIKLGISKNDPLFQHKSEVLTKIGISPSRSFFLHKGEFPVNGELLAFLRIFTMDEDLLKEKFGNDVTMETLDQLKNMDVVITDENEKKVWSFIETRAALLLKTYPTTEEEDLSVLNSGKELTDPQKMGLQLRIGEKQILESTIKYASEKRQNLEK